MGKLKVKSELKPLAERIREPTPSTEIFYDVMYTKHITQNQKVWHEGLFTFDLKSGKGVLYEGRDGTDFVNRLDCRTIKYHETGFDDDEQVKLNKFLICIEVS